MDCCNNYNDDDDNHIKDNDSDDDGDNEGSYHLKQKKRMRLMWIELAHIHFCLIIHEESYLTNHRPCCFICKEEIATLKCSPLKKLEPTFFLHR